jgi:hypothetical protein
VRAENLAAVGMKNIALCDAMIVVWKSVTDVSNELMPSYLGHWCILFVGFITNQFKLLSQKYSSL